VADGILVVAVFPTGPAEKAGLRSYDIIASVDGQPAKLQVGFYYRDGCSHAGNSSRRLGGLDAHLLGFLFGCWKALGQDCSAEA
jgi:C-terminal processing protease CtpA/Prc